MGAFLSTLNKSEGKPLGPLQVSDFVPLPSEGQGSITRFFTSAAAGSASAEAAPPSSDPAESAHAQPAGSAERRAPQQPSIEAMFKRAAASAVPAAHAAVEPHAVEEAQGAARNSEEAGCVSASNQLRLEEVWRGRAQSCDKDDGSGHGASPWARGAGGQEGAIEAAAAPREAGLSADHAELGQRECRPPPEKDAACSTEPQRQIQVGACEHDPGPSEAGREDRGGEAAGSSGLDLGDVDVEEQRRIMRDIWLRQHVNRGSLRAADSGRGAPAKKRHKRDIEHGVAREVGPKQLRINAMFKAPAK